MTLRSAAALALLCSLVRPCPAGDSVEAQIEEAPQAQVDAAWAVVEAARGTTLQAKALEEYLQAHPHGPAAARALLAQAEGMENLLEAAALLRLARGEDPQGPHGARAALELCRLEFQQGHPEAALLALEGAEEAERPGEIQAEWLYWRGLVRLALKGFVRAQADLELLLKEHPEHRLAGSASLGVAECLAGRRRDAEAYAAFEALWKGTNASYAAQALWGAAQLRARQSRLPEAKALFERLARDYPASFEAAAAAEKLRGLSAVRAAPPTPVPAPALRRYSVQVGAFGRKKGAQEQAASLKRRGHLARMEAVRRGGDVLYLVKVGRYKDKAQAERAAKRLRLAYRIVEE